jgi:hypothetical protein
MILYYAVGGGLGHLTRGRRVIQALGLDAVFVTASEYARDTRVTGGIPVIEVPAHLEHAPHEHREWLRTLNAERIIADAFPGGIQGELSGLDVPMDYVARILRWDEYRRVVPDELPRFETTWVVEELASLHVESARVAALTLPLEVFAEPARSPFWLVVHSGPAEEVQELVAYAAALRALADAPPPPVLVASRCSSLALPLGFAATDVFPAARLFAGATRIISAAGFNVMLETEPWRDKHDVVPFPRQFDDQYLRAQRRRSTGPRSAGVSPADPGGVPPPHDT